MPPAVHKRSRKAGLPPGTPVHIGSSRSGATALTLIGYDGEQLVEQRDASFEDCIAARGRYPVVWINVEGVHDVALLEKLAPAFGLHPLVVEDIANTSQRPKIEDYGETLYAVLRMLYYHENRHDLASEQVSLILGIDFVLSFQEGIEGHVFNAVRERLRAGKGRLRHEGPDFLLYSLMDEVVDSYFGVLERLGDRIEHLDEQMASSQLPEVSRPLHRLKRHMIWLRKAVWPLRELLLSLDRGESTLVRPSTRVYLKDVYDHTIEIIETVETYRDVLSSMLEIHLTLITNRLNEVMKVLTVIATIFIPLTFITGIYGMNFRHMPELDWTWAYPAVLAGMGALGVGLVLFFRRKKWL